MKLDRTINPDGDGKYALILKRQLRALGSAQRAVAIHALAQLAELGVYDDSLVGEPGEFMVIRLKDRFAQGALYGYANEARVYDPEYADEISAMAVRSGPAHPNCKFPD